MFKKLIFFTVAILLIFLAFNYLDEEKNGVLPENEEKEEVEREKEEQDKDSPVIPEKEVPKESGKELPKVSIIIDDLGNNFSVDKEIAKINADLTLAILPFRENTKSAVDFFANEQEIVLHLPLEPISKDQWEEKMITTAMSEKEIKEKFSLALEELAPYAVGVNNHKGSLFTADEKYMETLLKEVRKKDLFFVDSFTIGSSKGHLLAKEMGIKTTKRDIFLDNSREKEEIKRKLHKTVSLAKEQGSAVAIGHSFPETIEVLTKEIPKLKNEVNFVKVSQVLK